jgi:capsular polysaccharide biosynthesis protein
MQEKNIYEREIDLVQMIKYLWKRIGIICIGAVVGFVLILGMQMLTSSKTETVAEGEQTAFEKEMQEYEEDHAQLEMEIANLEKSIEEQIAYNNESILMKINPYDKKSVKGQFYIDSDYQIMPELTYQNTDITVSVAKAYQALASTGELAKYINEHLENPIKERYLNELITVSYPGDAVLEVTVVHTDIESAREIYDLVIECMNKSKAGFEKNIGKYNMTLLNESENAFVDLELKETQVLNLDTINTLKESLVEKRESFDALVMPTEGSGMALPVIGAFLGGFCVLGVYVILFLTDTTIKDEKDVASQLGLPLLGTIPAVNGSKKKIRAEKRNKKSRFAQYGNR